MKTVINKAIEWFKNISEATKELTSGNVSEHLGEIFISCAGCAYQDSCSSEQFGLGCYKGREIPQEEANRQRSVQT